MNTNMERSCMPVTVRLPKSNYSKAISSVISASRVKWLSRITISRLCRSDGTLASWHLFTNVCWVSAIWRLKRSCLSPGLRIAGIPNNLKLTSTIALCDTLSIGDLFSVWFMFTIDCLSILSALPQLRNSNHVSPKEPEIDAAIGMLIG